MAQGPGKSEPDTSGLDPRWPWAVELGTRPDPFHPDQEIQAWAGDGYVVLWGALAWTMKRAEAEKVAIRFGPGAKAVPVDQGLPRLEDVAAFAKEGNPDRARIYDETERPWRWRLVLGWARELRIPDERCPTRATSDGEALWRIRREADRDHLAWETAD